METFSYTRRVAFADTDAAGIVHFTAYLRYAEEAEHEFLRACGFPASVSGEGAAWPRVSCSWECGEPLRFGEEVVLTPEVEQIGDHSISWCWRFTGGATESFAGRVRLKTVCAELHADQGMRPALIPDALREELTRYVSPSDVDS